MKRSYLRAWKHNFSAKMDCSQSWLPEWWCAELPREITVTGEKYFLNIKISGNSSKGTQNMKKHLFK